MRYRLAHFPLLAWLILAVLQPAVASSPTAPTNLGATTISPSQINLTWTASAGAASYNVKHGTATGGPYTTVGSPTTTNYASTGLAAGTRYYFVITAVNASGESVPSAEISRATQCAAPTGFTATATTTQITLSWTTTKGATSYSLYRGTAAGGESGTAYQSGLTGTSYTDTAVTAGTVYYYTLKALNSGGTSAASNETTAILLLTAPTNLQAASTDAYVSLTWQAVAGAAHYYLYRTTSQQTAPTIIQSTSSTSTIDSTITLGQAYYYQVSALNAGGESPLSSQVSVTPLGNLKPVVKLTTPLNGITATAGTNLLLTAVAMPRSGTISKIDFYKAPAQYDSGGNPIITAGTLLGTSTTSPYQFVWNNLPSGNFFLTATATDNGGHSATSAPIVVSVASAPAGTMLTAAQAIQIARTFCAALGAPLSTGIPTAATVTAASPTYGGTVWQISFQGAASVEVADASSIVVFYFNYTLANQLNANTQGQGTAISQTQAQTIATSVVQASHLPSTRLGTPQFTQSNLVYPATYAGDLWTVGWNRVAGSVPYRTDQATLLLQAETGAVEAWKLVFPTRALVAVASTVSQSQAQSIAQAEMNAEGSLLGLSGQVFQAAQQVVVQPNTLWPPAGSTTPGTTTPIPGSASRTVWDCDFSNAPATGSPSGSTSSEIWVDAATGQVIGGDILRVKGRHLTLNTPIRPLVPMAKPHH